MTDQIAVPEEFRRLGFSGLFWTEAEIEPVDVGSWKDSAPCFLRGERWILLSVDETTRRGVIVQRDDAAVVAAHRGPGL